MRAHKLQPNLEQNSKTQNSKGQRRPLILFSLFKSTIKLALKTKKNSNQTQAIKSFSFFKCS
ncbi:hypothetical protein GP481_09505 [Acinetobacter sp. 105-3]|nr:hypothetical protein [Acinetobacter sp. 105-3]